MSALAGKFRTPHGHELAMLCAGAAFVDAALLRRLRLEFMPDADASAEQDVWWSDIVEYRGSNGLTFLSHVLDELRAELAFSARADAILDQIERLHAGGPPLLLLEERLIRLEVCGGTDAEIRACLHEAVAAIPQRRSEVLGWAERSLHRLPRRARAMPEAWSLSLALQKLYGVPLIIGSIAPAAAGTELAAWLPDENVQIGILWTADGFVAAEGAMTGDLVEVPATNPRVILVERGFDYEAVALSPGERVELGGERHALVIANLRGQRWRVTRRHEPAPDSALVRLETAFLELDAPADGPERMRLLEQLGEEYQRSGRHHDAALCRVRVIWELAGEEAFRRLAAWAASEQQLSGHSLQAAMAQAHPSYDDVRMVAAFAASATRPIPALSRVKPWLDTYDGALDLRTIWLARCGLSTLSPETSGDLAQTRERILQELSRGRDEVRELPAFLRLRTQVTAPDHLVQTLDTILNRALTVQRKRSGVEAPTELTHAYVRYQCAYGYAHLGQIERAAQLVHEAKQGLDHVSRDPVHHCLIAMYTARIKQASAHLSRDSPLPSAILNYYSKLDPIPKYKINRLREVSSILEPDGSVDATNKFHQRSNDLEIEHSTIIEHIRATVDVQARAQAIESLLSHLSPSHPGTGVTLQQVLDLSIELPTEFALWILNLAQTNIDFFRGKDTSTLGSSLSRLYAKALYVAAHFGDVTRSNLLWSRFDTSIRRNPHRELDYSLMRELPRLCGLGLRSKLYDLFNEYYDTFTELHKANAACFLVLVGDTSNSLPLLQSQHVLSLTRMGIASRLQLTRLLALAYSTMPTEQALSGVLELLEHLPGVSDSLSTNTHYNLAVLSVIDSLISGIVSHSFARIESHRRYLEDDEVSIRRRLHRDVAKVNLSDRG